MAPKSKPKGKSAARSAGSAADRALDKVQYTVDYDNVLADPPALRGHLDPLYRHPVEAETIRGRQVQKLQEAATKGGERLKAVGEHLAFVARQADPNRPGADYTNLSPYMEALEQLPIHQRQVILEAAGNPDVFMPALNKEMPELAIGQGESNWADDLFSGSPEQAPPDAQEQPVFAQSLGDVQDPDTKPGVVYEDGPYESRDQHPPEYRYSTYAGSQAARDQFRLEGRAARASGGLEQNPLIYDQMAEIKKIEKAGFSPTLPPVVGQRGGLPKLTIENDPSRGAYVAGRPDIMTVGTGAIGGDTPRWSDRKPLPIDIEVERRMTPARDKTVAKIESLIERAAMGDDTAIVDLDTLYPRWRAVLPEVDADGNVAYTGRPPSGQLLGGLIANAASIGDPTFPQRAAAMLDRSIQAQASLPPSNPKAMQYAQMRLTPSQDGIRFLSERARGGGPFPLFSDTNVPAYQAAPEAPGDASWADDLTGGATDPATGQIDPGEAWADQLFAEEAASQAGSMPPPAGDNWADQLDTAPPQDAPQGGNWADDLFTEEGPGNQDLSAFDTMNRRRAYNPLAALLA